VVDVFAAPSGMTAASFSLTLSSHHKHIDIKRLPHAILKLKQDMRQN